MRLDSRTANSGSKTTRRCSCVSVVREQLRSGPARATAAAGLGRVHHDTGDVAAAVTHHRQALELATDLRQPADQARAHDGLAHAYHTLRQHKLARQHWQDALDILAVLGTDQTEDQDASAPTIRAHLARYR